MNWYRWSALAVSATLAWGGVVLPAQAETPPSYSQWNLGTAENGVGATTAWTTSRGAGAVVGVIDTGISPHLDLTGSTTEVIGGGALPGFDFIGSTDLAGDGDGWDANPTDKMTSTDTNGNVIPGWHGLHVAGIVAAQDNGFGVTGVAPEAKVVPIRLVGMGGGVDTGYMDEAIRWGAGLPVEGAPSNVNPADALNLSIAVRGPCPAEVQSAIDAATAEGVAVVVAAGNTWDAKITGTRDLISGFFPGNCRGVITSTASDYNRALTDYSNIGDAEAPATIAAPGDVISTCSAGDPYCASGYAWSRGTSMSAPHVAAVIALLRSAQPHLTVSQLIEAITQSATPFALDPASSICTTSAVCGAGILNAAAALSYAADCSPPPTPSQTPTPTPSETGTTPPTPIDTPTPSQDPTPVLSDAPAGPDPSDAPTPLPSLAPVPSPTPSPVYSQDPPPAAPPIPVSIKLATRPQATGIFRAGHKVKARVGRWSPTPAEYRFQWYRNGKKIPKATRSTYRLTRSDRHRKISVRVTVSLTGYRSATAASTKHTVK